LDLLVKLGNQWYGSERLPGDNIDTLPLPKGYHWEVEGGFSGKPNGEAWREKWADEGMARLYGPEVQLLVEISLAVKFIIGCNCGTNPKPDDR